MNITKKTGVFFVAVLLLASACQREKLPKGADSTFVSALSAAHEDNLDSIFRVAFYLYEGIHVDKDVKEAISWIGRAAEMGDDGAMEMLGLAYKTGTGVEQDLLKAKEWFEKAIETNPENYDAYVGLADIYAVNEGNFEKAHQLADKALEIAPKDLRTLGEKGKLYILQNKREECLPYLRACDSIKPHYIMSDASFAVAVRAYADSIK